MKGDTPQEGGGGEGGRLARMTRACARGRPVCSVAGPRQREGEITARSVPGHTLGRRQWTLSIIL